MNKFNRFVTEPNDDNNEPFPSRRGKYLLIRGANCFMELCFVMQRSRWNVGRYVQNVNTAMSWNLTDTRPELNLPGFRRSQQNDNNTRIINSTYSTLFYSTASCETLTDKWPLSGAFATQVRKATISHVRMDKRYFHWTDFLHTSWT